MTTPHDLELAGYQDALRDVYTLERELGRGGMGIVYLAQELKLDRRVALKVLPGHLAADTEVRERFLREARTAAHLSHPNIVPVYRADEAGGCAYFAMGYVEGDSLAHIVQRSGPLPPDEAARILREVARALGYAHARGVVHRDVKPENIMIEQLTARAVVTDFGIAKRGTAKGLTQEGHVLGTAHYMSPEQVNGEPLDGRSDLYALGVVGFYMLSGRLPFEHEVATAVMVAHVTKPAPPLASVAPRVPAYLAAAVDRCLAKDRDRRFANGDELAAALAGAAVAGAVGDRTVSETDAHAIWERAAELQAEASGLHRAPRAPAPPPDKALQKAYTPGQGYRLTDVRDAAAEVGIAPEFLALADAEVSSDIARARPLSPREERLARALYGDAPSALVMTRVVRVAPSAALAAIGRVLPNYPYDLKLRENAGGHPLEGGILVFDVQPWMASAGTGEGLYFRYYLRAAFVHRLLVRLRAVPQAPDACEITVVGDLRKERRVSTRWILPPVTAVGAGGGGFGLASLAAATLGLGGALLALPAVAGAALGGLGATALLAWATRHGIVKAREQVAAMLDAVEEALRQQALFGVYEPPRRPPPADMGDDGFVSIVS